MKEKERNKERNIGRLMFDGERHKQIDRRMRYTHIIETQEETQKIERYTFRVEKQWFRHRIESNTDLYAKGGIQNRIDLKK